jgi:transcriptional regulator
MYIPTAFEQADKEKLFDFMQSHSFALLVSVRGGEPFATHLPLLPERDRGPHGCLLGHMARANPQWRDLDGRDVLAIFSGPHAYVSPSWYESSDVVPTWNYVAVHAYGTFQAIEADELAHVLTATVATYERSMPKPWSIDSASDYFGKMARGVVGFRIAISRLEGKWKLNQNHPRERREKVMRELARSADPEAREIAHLIAETLDGSARPL